MGLDCSGDWVIAPKWQRHYNPINISDNRPQETLPEQILPTETGHRYPQEWLVRNSAPKLLCYTIYGQINILSAIGLSLTPKLWWWLHTTTLHWSIIVILGSWECFSFINSWIVKITNQVNWELYSTSSKEPQEPQHQCRSFPDEPFFSRLMCKWLVSPAILCNSPTTS